MRIDILNGTNVHFEPPRGKEQTRVETPAGIAYVHDEQGSHTVAYFGDEEVPLPRHIEPALEAMVQARRMAQDTIHYIDKQAVELARMLVLAERQLKDAS